MKPIVVLLTCPTAEVAEKIGKTLIEDRLAACVQIGQPIQSIYRWNGVIEKGTEVSVSIKTQESCFDALCLKIGQIHPFEIPQIISIPISRGTEAYLAWLDQETR